MWPIWFVADIDVIQINRLSTMALSYPTDVAKARSRLSRLRAGTCGMASLPVASLSVSYRYDYRHHACVSVAFATA